MSIVVVDASLVSVSFVFLLLVSNSLLPSPHFLPTTCSTYSPTHFALAFSDKKAGGLGIKEVLSWNSLCVARTIFEMQEQVPSIWSKWILLYKLRGRDIWEANASDGDNYNWKSIIRLRDRLLELKSRIILIDLMRLPSGKYNSMNIYDLLRPMATDVNWSECIWGRHHIPRQSYISWLAINNGLTTLSKLSGWGINLDITCCLCNAEEEAIEHLLFNCNYSKAVLYEINQWMGISRIFLNISDWLQWLNGTRLKKAARYKLCCSSLTTTV